MILPLLSTAGDMLTKIGYQGLGPLAKDGLPIYIGRYVDRKTNRLKLLPRPNFAVNPSDQKQVYAKLMYNLAYKWNQFAQSVQSVYKFAGKANNWETVQKTLNY